MFRAHIANTVPKFGQLRHLDVKTHEKSQRHEEKREGKERINLTDNLVDRQHRGKNIINKDYDYPHSEIAPKAFQNLGGTVNEHRTNENEQQDRENEHDGLCRIAEILTHKLGQAHSVVADRKHSA